MQTQDGALEWMEGKGGDNLFDYRGQCRNGLSELIVSIRGMKLMLSLSADTTHHRQAKFSTALSSFKSRQNEDKPVELFLFVSFGQNRRGENVQTGHDLESFIELVNRSRFLPSPTRNHSPILALSKITVVLSGALYSNYVGEKEAKEIEEKWRKEEGKLLETKLAPEFKFNAKSDIWGWEKVTSEADNPLYGKALQSIKRLYSEDKKFQDIIVGLIDQHASKYKLTKDEKEAGEAVKNYIFGESAVFLTFGKPVCYPAPKFNDAVLYVLNELKGKDSPPYPGSPYLGYEFKNVPSPTLQTDEEESKDSKNRKNSQGKQEKTQYSAEEANQLVIPKSYSLPLMNGVPSIEPLGLLSTVGMFSNPQQKQVFLKTVKSLQKQRLACLERQLALLQQQKEFEQTALEVIGQAIEGTGSALVSSMS